MHIYNLSSCGVKDKRTHWGLLAVSLDLSLKGTRAGWQRTHAGAHMCMYTPHTCSTDLAEVLRCIAKVTLF